MESTRDDDLLDQKIKLLDSLMRLWSHADAYLWARARLIVAIQAGVLAGAFAVRDVSVTLGIGLLVAGIVFSSLLFLMVKRDEQTRDSYRRFTDPLAKDIFGPPLYGEPLEFELIPPPNPSKAPIPAGRAIDIVFVLLIVVDILAIGMLPCLASR